MRINFQTPDGDFYSIDVMPEMDIASVKAVLEADCGIPVDQQVLSFKNKILNNGAATLQSEGVGHEDMLLLQKKIPQQAQPPAGAQRSNRALPFNIDWGSLGAQSRPQVDPRDQQLRQLYDSIRSVPAERERMRQGNPAMVEAAEKGDFQAFKGIILQWENARMEHERKKAEMMRRAQANPMDVEAQKFLEDETRRRNVQERLEHAMEHTPEQFGHITMLYINCKVNDHPIKAFVDSGAQMSIMSKATAERCGILAWLDDRFATMAVGVGSAKVLGKIFMVKMQVEGDFQTIALSIMEDQNIDMILGLDMLRGLHCSINLEKNVLRFGATGTETPFLAEHELPEHAKQQLRGKAPDESAKSPAQDASSSTTSAPSAAASAPKEPPANPEHVETLVSMGYDRTLAQRALSATNNSIDQAVEWILAHDS
eukprot:Clim_evm1s175 gene=Clim_evmTU1s175